MSVLLAAPSCCCSRRWLRTEIGGCAMCPRSNDNTNNKFVRQIWLFHNCKHITFSCPHTADFQWQPHACTYTRVRCSCDTQQIRTRLGALFQSGETAVSKCVTHSLMINACVCTCSSKNFDKEVCTLKIVTHRKASKNYDTLTADTADSMWRASCITYSALALALVRHTCHRIFLEIARTQSTFVLVPLRVRRVCEARKNGQPACPQPYVRSGVSKLIARLELIQLRRRPSQMGQWLNNMISLNVHRRSYYAHYCVHIN